MNAEFYKHNNPVITMTIKNYGDITIELVPDVAPNTVSNFINLIENDYFTNANFHRVIRGFMIQGGMGDGTAKPIRGEFASNGHQNPLKHTRGVISMARTQDRNSASSQFFLMHHDSPHLDGEYASFGYMTDGFDILDDIADVKTGANDVPNVEVVIEKMTVDTKGLSYPIVQYTR